MQTRFLRFTVLAMLVAHSACSQATSGVSVGGGIAQVSLRTTERAADLIKNYRFHEAQQLLEKDLDLYRKRFGLSDPQALDLADLLIVSYRDQSMMQQAMDLAKKTFERSEKALGKLDPKTLDRLKILAEIHLRLSSGDLLSLHFELVSRLRSLGDELRLARALALSSEAAMSAWNPEIASQYLGEAIEIFSKQAILQPLDRIHLYSLVASHMRWKGDFEEAKRMGAAALHAASNLQSPDPVVVARVLQNNGLIYNSAGELQTALENFTTAYEMLSKNLGARHLFTLNAEREMSLTNLRLGHEDKALIKINKSLNVAREIFGNDTLYLAGWLVDYAKALMAISRYEEALILLKQGEAIASKSLSENHLAMAYGYELLASAYGALSQHDQELIYRNRAYGAYERSLGRDHYMTLFRKNGLAHTYNELGQHAKAAEIYAEVALGYRKQFGRQSEHYANALTSWANVESQINPNFNSLPHYEQSLEILAALLPPEAISVRRLRQHLAFGYMAAGQSQRALEILQDVKKYAVGVDLVSVYVGETRIFRKLEKPDMAFASAQEALKLSAEYGSQLRIQSIALSNMSTTHHSAGDLSGSIYWAKMNVNIHQEIRARVRNIGSEEIAAYTESVSWTYQWLAFLLIQEGRLAEAQQVLDMLKEDELFEFIRRSSNADPRRTRIGFTPDEARWSTGYKEVSDRLAALGAEQRELLQKTKRGLSAAEKARAEAIKVELAVAEKAFAAFLSDMQRTLKAQGPAKVDEVAATSLASQRELKSLIRDLGPDVVLLQYYVTNSKVGMILTTPDVVIPFSTEIDSRTLNSQVFQLRNALRDPKRNVLGPAQELYRLLLAPVASALEQTGAKTIMLSLDGQLRHVPFGALHDGKQFAAQKWSMPIYTAVTRDRLREGGAQRWTAAGLGVTRAFGEFKALPAVRAEMDNLLRTTGGRTGQSVVYLDERFTAQRLKEVGQRNFQLMHISSHFSISPGTETNSFLLLGDGQRLTLGDIRTQNFRFDNVDLLTLAACDTGVGGGRDSTGKEIEGLGVIAQQQGAKAVLATLWPVADGSTAKLITDMYQRHQTQGLSKIEALRQAQLAMMSQSKYAHPFYWAPFILLGNWQ